MVYFNGSVGGLMTSLKVDVKNERGELLKDGTFEKTEKYGALVAGLAGQAVKSAIPVELLPFAVRTRPMLLPVENNLYKIGKQVGTLKRAMYEWKGQTVPDKFVETKEMAGAVAVRTEVGLIRLGELDIAAIPGEIYPELVLGKVQDPADPGADFPTAPVEPAIYAQLKSKHRMLIGLANDELGYFIPKRRVDERRLEAGMAGGAGHAKRIRRRGRIAGWLLRGYAPAGEPGPYEREGAAPQHPWWRVMCLTGVDYFSSLGYAPGISAIAAGVLAPVATLILALVTLFGALPMYRRVAGESPHGDGSISMLERLLPWWQGKLFVLGLIGFVATGFVITITLSAADAAAHVAENPLAGGLRGHEVPLTLALIALLGAVFLRGFGEAIGIAVALVAAYLALNLVVLGDGIVRIVQHPQLATSWREALARAYDSPLAMLGAALLVFPKLALGLSGFETGVLVLPLVQGDPGDDPARPAGRIRNGRKLLTVAAAIMSTLLLASSAVTTLLIPQPAFQPGGAANGRALAYLAHRDLGDVFGTVYDASTIAILWFAGASAMAGLLNIVPRYLPRYGMAPDWTRATRPLVLIYVAICFAVTLFFRASVDAQAGAYATGVLALLTSASVAVTLSARRQRRRPATIAFGVVSLIFLYTIGSTIRSQPEGLAIAAVFIAAIVATSLVSRVYRSTELRVGGIVLDATAQRFVDEACRGTIRIIANHPDDRSAREYLLKEREQRADSHIPPGEPVLFLEVSIADASEFAPTLRVTGHQIGAYRVLRAEGAAIPNAIAAILLHLRDTTGKRPHIYFGWTEGNPLKYLAHYILFGEGDIAPLTHEVLRQAEPDPRRRPAIHVG